MSRFGKMYYEEPHNIKTIDVVGSSLSDILNFYDDYFITNKHFDPSKDSIRSFIIHTKKAITDSQLGKPVNDEVFKFLVKMANVETLALYTERAAIGKFKDLFKKPVVKPTPTRNIPRSDNPTQLDLF